MVSIIDFSIPLQLPARSLAAPMHSSFPHHSSLYQPPSLPLPLPLGLAPNPPLIHPLQAQLHVPLGQGALSTSPLSLHIPSLPMHVPSSVSTHTHLTHDTIHCMISNCTKGSQFCLVNLGLL